MKWFIILVEYNEKRGTVILKYDILLFDADDTLFDFRKSEKEAFLSTLKDYHLEEHSTLYFTAYHHINSKIWKEFEEGRITQSALKIERFQRLKDTIGADFQAEDFAERYTDHLSEASFPFEESYGLLEKLSGRVKMGIITNGLKKVQRKRIRESVLGHYFDAIVISEEVKVSKPDERIFQLTLDLLGQPPKEKVLMVGDSLSSDILGGLRFGIDTCWFNPGGKTKREDICPTYEISHLHELLNLL